MNGFKPSIIIKDPKYLFGRNKKGELLDRLFTNIKRGTNCQLQGERRSGKTSSLWCLINLIRSENQSILPIYFDFKETSIINNDKEVYKTIIAKCVAHLSINKFISEKNEIRNYNIEPNEDWVSVYENIPEYSKIKLQGIIKELILFYSEYNDVKFVFLIDEYEYLMAKALENPVGFMFLRNLSDEMIGDSLKPLTYIIAGSKSWITLCNDIGSPELNNQGVGINYLSPLSYDSFKEMWEFAIKEIREDLQSILLNIKNIYNLTGGVPYYAKKVGESVMESNASINYLILKSDFIIKFNNLSEEEKETLFGVIQSQISKNKGLMIELSSRGLLKNDKNWDINGSLFKEFIIENRNFTIDPSKKEMINNSVEKIFHYITLVNKTCSNIKIDYIFELVPDENDLRMQMKGTIFSEFTSSIYKTIFERTAKQSGSKRENLKNLPAKFSRSNSFVKMVDSLRHEFGGHLTFSSIYTPLSHQFSRENLLIDLTGNRNEPEQVDFIDMQITVLSRFEQYLSNLLNHMKTIKK